MTWMMCSKEKPLLFDAENRLTQYGTGSTLALNNGYTPDGLRAWKLVGGASAKTYYLYDGDHPVCELNPSNGAVKRINTWGANGLVSRDRLGSRDEL